MNEALTVQVNNPFLLREALLIALEIAWPDLSPEQQTYVREFTLSIPSRHAPPLDLTIDQDGARPLRLLSGYFSQTKTCHYLHDGLKNALTRLMIPLTEGAQA